ncbi:DUF2125 domain-containing protein [Kaustia mangrovi]|uniref:DUF2125 domain-containing protein n=1 Tax=Kaustia mangrovi TaxID=2593653 RepID=A0A7S8C2Q7_9HYPH|nr:DUF2125 domain-containing protein [Kaustia mangrovi]QPC42291.1 DUF2125 domain-containing protein [Kaustia mangrovi]
MALPLALVIALALAWSGYWWFMFSKAKEEFGRWQAHAEDAGVTLGCGSQGWGGYPFRVEMDCEPLELSWSSRDGTSEIRLAGLQTVSQVYDPQHVLAAGASPAAMRSLDPGAGEPSFALAATYDPATASVRFDRHRPDRLSLVVEALRADITERKHDGAGDARVTNISADSFDLHFRFVDPPRDGRAQLELASDGSAVRAEGRGLVSALGEPLDLDRFELRARADRVPYPIDNPDVALRGFAADGGTLTVDRLLAKSGPVSFVARGTLALDKRGRATGDLTAEVVNMKGLLSKFERAGKIGRTEAQLAAGLLSFLEGATTGDKGAISVDMRVKKGKIYFGPFKVAEIPPLF